MFPRKQTTEPKLVILVSFSQEKLHHTQTDTSIHIIIAGCSMPLRGFFWATLYVENNVVVTPSRARKRDFLRYFFINLAFSFDKKTTLLG